MSDGKLSIKESRTWIRYPLLTRLLLTVQAKANLLINYNKTELLKVVAAAAFTGKTNSNKNPPWKPSKKLHSLISSSSLRWMESVRTVESVASAGAADVPEVMTCKNVIIISREMIAGIFFVSGCLISCCWCVGNNLMLLYGAGGGCCGGSGIS